MKNSSTNKANEVKTVSQFAKYQASHKAAKNKAASIGGCLAWVINNHEDKNYVNAAKVAQENYKLFVNSGLPKANKVSGKFNAYQIGWAADKFAKGLQK